MASTVGQNRNKSNIKKVLAVEARLESNLLHSQPIDIILDRAGPHLDMADLDAALMQKILSNTKRQREPDLHHHRQAKDLGAGLEVAKGRAFGYPCKVAGNRM